LFVAIDPSLDDDGIVGRFVPTVYEQVVCNGAASGAATGEPDDAVKGQEKGNVAQAPVEMFLSARFRSRFFKRILLTEKNETRMVAGEARLWK
jgi:hypothetical protein